jgi:hypothetical protein
LLYKLAGNKAVHFLEDTFSGENKKATQLTLDPRSGAVFPEVPLERYEGETLTKRQVALQALKNAAGDLSGEDELNSLTSARVTAILYPLLHRLLHSQEKGLQRIMIPHEK